YYLPPQNVYAFSAGSGLALASVSQILPNHATYTIALQARDDSASGDGYNKLIDYDNGADDYGLYDYFNHLIFYSYSAGAAAPMIPGNYGDIVVTRDADAVISGYYNGALQFTTDDSIQQWGRVYAPDVLRFFLDDVHGGGTEASAGAVA